MTARPTFSDGRRGKLRRGLAALGRSLAETSANHLPAEAAERIRVQQVDALGRLSRDLGFAGPPMVAIVAWACRNEPHASRAVPWYAAVLAFYVGIYLYARYADRRNRLRGQAPLLIRGYNLVMTGLGLAWGGLFVTLVPASNAEQRALLFALAAGLIAPAPLKMPVSTALTALLPISAAALAMLWWMGSEADAATALLLVGYNLLLGSAILQQNRAGIRRVLHEFELADKQEVISLLLREFEDNASDWLWSTDETMRLRHASPRLALVLGRDAERLAGQPLRDVFHGDAGPETPFAEQSAMLLTLMERRAMFSGVRVPVPLGGEIRWWALTGKPQFDRFGHFTGYQGVGTDITAARRSEEKITRLARFDSLTGLCNRASFAEQLREACERPGQPGSALLCLDLDEFKSVNDTHGHSIGDRVLTEVARRIQTVLRKPDTAARFGGDEFAVLARDCGPEAAAVLAHRLVERLCQPLLVDGITAEIGASVGIAMLPADGADPELLMSRADLALYRAKADGRRTWRFFERQMDEQLRERQGLRADLRQALARDEFHLDFQPILDLSTLRVAGFEALARWTHPERGELPPALFIPIAEEARLIDAVGAWALRSACAAATTWPDRVRIAVNLSPLQFRDPGLPEIVANALAATGLAPDRLELELTESILLESTELSEIALKQLRALGVRLVLDDFGTGYSSFHYLRDFDFEKIKIDRSYIRDIAEDGRAQALIEGFIGMANRLGVTITAEGVETAEQVSRLREFGCDEAQGFFFARPVPLDRAQAYIAANATPASTASLPLPQV